MACPIPTRDAPTIVSTHNLEALLAELQALPGDAKEGFFGPASVTWTVNRECAVFLGAGRAALLQLAHPWVSVALQQHSNLMNDAIGRFHSTFRVIYTMLFGTRSQALTASRQLHAVHTSIQGTLPADIGVYSRRERYQANEVSALRWVFATLVESAILAYEVVQPPLSLSAREAFYRESFRMAALCGIPTGMLPQDWAALTQYTADIMASAHLAVDAQARAMGQAVLDGVGTWVKSPLWYRALTASWLPPHLREGFGLPFGESEQRSLARARTWLARSYPHLPEALRFVGPYHEAHARLRNRVPGRFVRQSNRFWMGRPRLLYAEEASDLQA